jgi:predicted GIY-YIG superfamily endonuclease
VGTVLFVILQGRKFGPTAHARYFQLKQMKKQEKERFIEQRKAAYARLADPRLLESRLADPS